MRNLIGRTLTVTILFILFFLASSSVNAHPGRTDANGGHTCRTNCSQYGLQDGEYHNHNGGGSTVNNAPVQEAQAVSAPVVQQQIVQTIPTKSPTRVPTKTQTVKAVTTSKYAETEYDKKKLFKVVSVTDGDTINVSIRGKIEPVRLLAIDTPETKDPRKPIQCFGMEASKKMTSMVNGKIVKLVDDRTQGGKDKYNRLLRYAYLEDGTFVNAEMVKQGYAFSYKEYPTKYLNDFNNLEKQAREKGLGLWSACNTTTPTKPVIKTPSSKPVQQTQQQSPQVRQFAPAVDTSGGDRDCGDFSTHAEAQAFFNAAGAGDPHRLDADKDGLACENLP